MCGNRRVTTCWTVFVLVFYLFLSSVFVCAQEGEKPSEKIQDYTIGAGDVLKITTWKEPDFSIDSAVVRTDGKITIPLVNDVVAAGVTTMELKVDIEKRLAQYVDTPFVTVAVVDPVSQRFYILGEVVNTGGFPLVKNLTVMQAFAVAGGFTEWASKKEIILFRKEGKEEKIIKINYKDILKGDFSNNIPIKVDDTIIVP